MHTPRPGLSPKQRAIEIEHGKPWERVADEFLVKYRKWGKVAERLDVDQATLRRWRLESDQHELVAV